jgi:predicted outer membrane repeat protein
MHATVLRNNSATQQGGAVVISTRLHASNCVFMDNAVFNLNSANNFAGSGGALFVDGTGSVALLNSTLVNNHAGYGGAIYAAADSTVTLSSAVHTDGNQASRSGGAAYITDASVLSLSQGVLVNGNTAGADGGGIATTLNSTLNLGPDVNIINNIARNDGGGIYASDTSNLTFNPPTPTSRVSIVGNKARNTGGGFCLLSEVPLTLVFPWKAVKAAASLNTAPYGADVYVPTERLQLVNGSAQFDVISRLEASSVQLTVNATGYQGIPSALLVQASLQGIPLSSLKTDDTTGLATFKVPVRKPPGQYPLTFSSATASNNAIDGVTVLLNVLTCPMGDVVASTGDACITCVAGSFSLNPRNTTCDKCPDNAVCPGAWAVLPAEGFWSSSPHSIQIHR